MLDKLIIFILILFAWSLLALVIPYTAAIALMYVYPARSSILTSIILIAFLLVFVGALYFWFYIAKKYVEYKVRVLRES